jgi:serine/threonine protein kinase
VVYRGTFRGQTVAVKRQRIASHQVLCKTGTQTAESGCRREYKDLMQEIIISAQLPEHPNICRFHGACLDPLDHSVFNFVYEYVEGSNLEQVYALMSQGDDNFRPPLDLALSWCIHLADGLACMHACNPACIHRDIKPDNLLISYDLTLKICDFGLCTLREVDDKGCKSTPARRMTGCTGAYRYMAPEVLLDIGEYDTSVDIFSAASCIYFMTTGQVVMSEIEDPMIVAKGVCENVRQPLNLLLDHPALAATISAAWDSDPAQRPTAPALAALLRAHRAHLMTTTPHSTVMTATLQASIRSGKSLLRSMAAMRDNILGYLRLSKTWRARAATRGKSRSPQSSSAQSVTPPPSPPLKVDYTDADTNTSNLRNVGCADKTDSKTIARQVNVVGFSLTRNGQVKQGLSPWQS